MKLSKPLRHACAAILVSATAMAYAGAALAAETSNGTLILAHESNPDDIQDFIYMVDGPTPGGAGLDDDATAPGGDDNIIKTKTFSVTPGDYTISQTNPAPGWVLTGIQCDGPTPAYPNLPQRSVSLNVATGTMITCKFLNERASAPLTGSITIRKQTTPNHPLLFGAWPGQGATCVFTNRKETPTTGNVTIIKKLVPAGDPGKFTLQLTPQGGTLLANFLNGGNSATLGPITVPTGNYIVSEVAGNGTSLSNYTAVISGAGCGANGAITMTTGANIVCTITNTRNTAAPLPCLANHLLNATVNFYVPGWAIKNICRGGTVTFNKTAGNGFTVTPSVPAGSFTPIHLAAGVSSGTTGPFANTGTTPITYKYWSTAGATQGSIIVW